MIVTPTKGSTNGGPMLFGLVMLISIALTLRGVGASGVVGRHHRGLTLPAVRAADGDASEVGVFNIVIY